MTEDIEETIYDEEGRKELSDDSEISPEEDGFMKGYDEADKEEELEKKKEKKDEEE